MSVLDRILKGRNVKLPSLPVVGLKIIDAVKGDDFSVEELSSMIAVDPALAVRTLKMANSALYVQATKVDSIERAVTVLGAMTLKNLALSFLIVREMKQDYAHGFDHEHFWKKSVTAAVAAQTLAGKLGKRSDDTFLSALLMDIGKIVLNSCMNDEYMQALDEQKIRGGDIAAIERTIFDFDHQDVGAEMLRKWNIPQSIYSPIAFHHDYKKSPPEYADCARILMISSAVSSVYNCDRSTEALDKLDAMFEGDKELNKISVSGFIDEVADKASEVLSVFNIDPGDMKPYSVLMEEANEELSSLNLSYERIVMELKESKERSEKFAVELKRLNEELRHMAFKDSLTGLYNQRFFHDAIDRELSRAERVSSSFALIMLDVDNFKDINDNYGHTKGDMVLKSIGSRLSGLVRQCDMAIRLGGDEFAVLMPDTFTYNAVMLAERIRRDIEKNPVVLAEVSLPCTFSIGVGMYDPANGKKEKSVIIDEIDRALYKSKSAGRNRITEIAPSV